MREETTTPTDVFTCSTWNGPLELRVGDEVGVMPGGYSNRIPTVRRVAKITHKGRRVRLDEGSEFNERGTLVGTSTYNRSRLMSADKARQLADPRQSSAALTKVLADVAYLANQLAREHGAPLPAEKKAELLSLVERL